MVTRNHEHGGTGEGVTEAEATGERTAVTAPADAGGRPLGNDVRVVSRRTVVDGAVRHEIGFERRPGT